MRVTLAMLCLSASLSCLFAAGEAGPLKVHGGVPGLTPSDKYSFRVRPAGDDNGWQARGTPLPPLTGDGRLDQTDLRRGQDHRLRSIMRSSEHGFRDGAG